MEVSEEAQAQHQLQERCGTSNEKQRPPAGADEDQQRHGE